MISELYWETLCNQISDWESNSLDFVLLMTAAIPDKGKGDTFKVLTEFARVLKPGGLLFVHGTPKDLPPIGVHLDHILTFKYWIVVESALREKESGLPTKHAAVLLFSKGKRFQIRQLRFPHQHCKACGHSLKDWGANPT